MHSLFARETLAQL